jgi:Gamma-glutamyltranspeptidase
VLGVTDPFSRGIGGGGFMVIYLADAKSVVTIDHREVLLDLIARRLACSGRRSFLRRPSRSLWPQKTRSPCSWWVQMLVEVTPMAL